MKDNLNRWLKLNELKKKVINQKDFTKRDELNEIMYPIEVKILKSLEEIDKRNIDKIKNKNKTIL